MDQRRIKNAVVFAHNIALFSQKVWSFLKSPGGMKTLAANCMLIEAIGESVKKIDSKTNGLLLCQCAEIPWRNIKGMRDHIAHGYFDINVDFIWDVIQNDLTPLKHAVDYLIKYCE